MHFPPTMESNVEYTFQPAATAAPLHRLRSLSNRTQVAVEEHTSKNTYGKQGAGEPPRRHFKTCLKKLYCLEFLPVGPLIPDLRGCTKNVHPSVLFTFVSYGVGKCRTNSGELEGSSRPNFLPELIAHFCKSHNVSMSYI